MPAAGLQMPWAAAQDGAGDAAGAAPAAAEVPAPVAVSIEERQRDAQDAALEAEEALDDAIAMARVLDDAIAKKLREAQEKLRGGRMHDAAAALRLVTAAPPSPGLKAAMARVGNLLRDVVVLRCRCHAPPGDREAFLIVVREAFGGTMETQEIASVLLACRKRMGLLPDAFRSKNQEAHARRGRARQRRRRNSPQRAGAAAAAMVADEQPMWVTALAGQDDPMYLVARGQQQESPQQQASGATSSSSGAASSGPALYSLFGGAPSSGVGLNPWTCLGIADPSSSESPAESSFTRSRYQ